MQANKRRDKDVTKILVSGYHVDLVDENRLNEFIVDFHGPKDSPYEGVSSQIQLTYFQGLWQVRVTIPDQYPIKSPSIGFINKIFHPNVDEA